MPILRLSGLWGISYQVAVQTGPGAIQTGERRIASRVKVALQAEIKPVGSHVPIRVSTSDLSLSGCYVEMMFTLEVDRKLEIVLWLGGHQNSGPGASPPAALSLATAFSSWR